MMYIGCKGHFVVEGRYIGQPRKYYSNACRMKSYESKRPKRPGRSTVHNPCQLMTPEQRACRIACGLPA